MADKLEIDLALDIADALSDIKSFTSAMKRQVGGAVGIVTKSLKKLGSVISAPFKKGMGALKGFGSALISTKGLVAGLVAALAARGLFGALSAVTEAASIQEDAINSLNTAMKLSGEFSADASKEMQDFASNLQGVSKFGDEAILSQLALAKAFGASNEQAKLIVTAAAELSAATGKSLEEANRQISKTLGGFAGELGEVNPAIKSLTEEQLKAGAAAKILIDQYGGSAASQIQTFSGAVTQTKNTFGDLLEQIGFVITRNPAVIKAINSLNKVFQNLIKFVTENQQAISNFVSKAVALLVRGFGGVISFAAKATGGITGFISALLELKAVVLIVQGLGKVFDGLRIAAVTAFEGIITGFNALLILANEIPGLEGDFDPAINAVREFRESVTETKDVLIDSFARDDLVDTKPIRDNLAAISDTTKEVGNDVEKFTNDLAQQIDSINNQTVTGPKTTPTKTAKPASGQTTDKAALSDAGKLGVGLSKQLIDGLAKGGEGAKDAIAGSAGAIADAFLPGIGGLVTSVLNLLQDPEAIRGLVEGFVQALPEVLNALAEGAPILVEAIADNLDEIIIALIKAMPAIARALVFEAVPALIRAIPEIVTSLVSELASEITGKNIFFDPSKILAIGEEFSSKIQAAFKDPIEQIERPFREFADFLRSFSFDLPGGGKSAGNAISNVGQSISAAIGLNSGGTVPQGFPNDTFPAALTSGELVVPKNDVDNLRNFIAQGGGSDMAETNALLVQLITEVRSKNAQSEIGINQDGLSELILELNRNNERLSA